MPSSLLPEWFAKNVTLAAVASRAVGLLFLLLAAIAVLATARVLTRRLATRFAKGLALENGRASLLAAERAQRVDTVLRVTYSVVRVVVWGFVVMTCLAALGVSVQPLVAGAGLAGAAIAFGSQTIVKDYVSGFFVILEDQYDIGDTVTFSAGFSGVVETMTLRVTTLRAVDGSLHIVPNGAIGVVTNKTRSLGGASVTVQVAMQADSSKVRGALEAAAKTIVDREKAEKDAEKAVTVAGPLGIKERGVEWSLTTTAEPAQVDALKQRMLEAAIVELQKAEVPFVQA